MDTLESLEKAAELRNKNILNEEEYNLLKKSILVKHGAEIGAKSGVAYALLASFLGMFGAHNFYAGYTKRAVIQLLMTLFSWILLFIPLFIVQLWVLGDLWLINKDAKNEPFVGDKTLVIIIRVAVTVMYLFSGFMMFLGVIAAMTAPTIASVM